MTDSSARSRPSNGEYITDEAGRIVITDLEPGTTITAREVKTVEGYVLDGAPKSIEIKAGEVQTLRFYNEAKGTLVIRKLDSVTKEPLPGWSSNLTYADGGYVDADNGHLSSKGLYTTDQNGEIRISGITGTIVVKETKTIPGYTIDPAGQSQTVVVKPGRYPDFDLLQPAHRRRGVHQGQRGRIGRSASPTPPSRSAKWTMSSLTPCTYRRGWAASCLSGGWRLLRRGDRGGGGLPGGSHAPLFEVEGGKTVSLTVTNKAFSGILIHKVDADTVRASTA